MKKWIIAFVFASSIVVASANIQTSAAFNGYGLQVSEEQWGKLNEASDWTEMNRADFVPLKKQWKVTFNQKVKLENIEAAVVEGANGLHPVKVAIGAKNEILVTPEVPYEKDATYELKIALKNGKKFVIPFTTEREPIHIDVEPNFYVEEATPLKPFVSGYGSIQRVRDEYGDFDFADVYEVRTDTYGKITLKFKSEDAIRVFLTDEDMPHGSFKGLTIDGEGEISFTASKKAVYVHIQYVDSSAGKEIIQYQIDTSFQEPILTPKEWKRYENLKLKWSAYKPTYTGEQAEGTRNEPPYQVGRATAGALQDALNITKMMRYTAGVHTNIALNEEYNKHAQYGASLIIRSATFDHYPLKPADMSESDYEIGLSGTASSNLSTGYDTIADSVIAYMDDIGNEEHVGHRSWVLNPWQKHVGFGFNNHVTPMYVSDYDDKLPKNFQPVVWPAETVMPLELTWGARRAIAISMSFDPEEYVIGELDRVTVEVTYNGKKYILTKENTEYFYVESRYGWQSQVLIVKPEQIKEYNHGDKMHVKVKGLKSPSGQSKQFEYETKFLFLE